MAPSTPDVTHMLIKVDATQNNNKFWELTLHSGGGYSTRHGRVGGAGQTCQFIGDSHQAGLTKMRSKISSGYRPVDVLTGSADSVSVAKAIAKKKAVEDIAGNDQETARLIGRLADANRHQLLHLSGGHLDLDVLTGIVRTPLGVVGANSIYEAKQLLPQLWDFVQKKKTDSSQYLDAIQRYLMLVPQKVGSRAGWHRDFMNSRDALQKQSQLLDQLEASVQTVGKQLAQGTKDAAHQVFTEKVFEVKVSRLTSDAVFKRIETLFYKTLNKAHAAKQLKPKAVWEITIPTMAAAFDDDGAKLSNRMELWHGTRVHNVLSILKQGLIIPPRNHASINITGRMFGDGIYFSDQSTKALNYSYGYWDAGARDTNCFMFLADVGMGRMFVPKGSISHCPAGYDSVYAKASVSGVHNNEMIISRTSQANLRYLVEFEKC